jgi:hypothetical protein
MRAFRNGGAENAACFVNHINVNGACDFARLFLLRLTPVESGDARGTTIAPVRVNG